MTIDRKVEYLEKARKEGASSAQIERLCAVLWPVFAIIRTQSLRKEGSSIVAEA